MTMSDYSFVDESILIVGPSFHVDLAPLDARHPVHYSQRLLIFHCESPAQRAAQVASLRTGLQALVLRCPILGGVVVPQPDDVARPGDEDWRTIVPGEGIEFILKDLRRAIPSFAQLEREGFPSQSLLGHLLVPVPEELGNDRPFAACKVQYSAIDGGSILTFSMSHSVADGSGQNELMRILSQAVRIAQENSGTNKESETPDTRAQEVVGQDRSILRNLGSDLKFDIKDHPAFRWKTSSIGDTVPPEEESFHPLRAGLPEIPVLLHFSSAALAMLKRDASQSNNPPISTHDALCALVWRTMLLIRTKRSVDVHDLPPSIETKLFLPFDARRHLNLPMSYIGNAVYQLSAKLDLSTLLSPSGLKDAANAVRRAIIAVKPALVVSYMAMLKEKWVDWGFEVAWDTTDVAMGTDWTSGSIYADDWGKAFGAVVSYRYPAGAFCCILPKLPDGSAEVMMGVQPDEVGLLKSIDGFGKYLEM